EKPAETGLTAQEHRQTHGLYLVRRHHNWHAARLWTLFTIDRDNTMESIVASPLRCAQIRFARLFCWLCKLGSLEPPEAARSMVSHKLIELHERERTWLARELHDDINQRLCLIAMSLEHLQEAADASLVGLRQGIGHAVQEVAQLNADIQRLSHGLHS